MGDLHVLHGILESGIMGLHDKAPSESGAKMILGRRGGDFGMSGRWASKHAK